MSEKKAPSPDEESEPLITDKRRIDPETGDVRAGVDDSAVAGARMTSRFLTMPQQIWSRNTATGLLEQRPNSRTSAPGSNGTAKQTGTL
jgi:hypothetical protein